MIDIHGVVFIIAICLIILIFSRTIVQQLAGLQSNIISVACVCIEINCTCIVLLILLVPNKIIVFDNQNDTIWIIIAFDSIEYDSNNVSRVI